MSFEKLKEISAKIEELEKELYNAQHEASYWRYKVHELELEIDKLKKEAKMIFDDIFTN
jgi:uncharacterized coiled-coil DUF342 family protein